MNKNDTDRDVIVSPRLIDEIRTYPLSKIVEHCGSDISISPFDIYATCKSCGKRIKVRSFSASPEIEDIFDAVFEWLEKPEAQSLYKKRQKEILEDISD